MENIEYQGYDFEAFVENHTPSQSLQRKVARYEVSEEDIRNLLFSTSTRSLCILTDKVLMEYCPEDLSEVEFDKMVSIAAMGLNRKYLTEKQKWCLASFCLYYLENGKRLQHEEVFAPWDGHKEDDEIGM